MKEKFNQQKYIDQYKKENYSRFSTVLKKDEMKKLQELMDKLGMNRAEFLRYAMEKLDK